MLSCFFWFCLVVMVYDNGFVIILKGSGHPIIGISLWNLLYDNLGGTLLRWDCPSLTHIDTRKDRQVGR